MDSSSKAHSFPSLVMGKVDTRSASTVLNRRGRGITPRHLTSDQTHCRAPALVLANPMRSFPDTCGPEGPGTEQRGYRVASVMQPLSFNSMDPV